MHLSRDTAEHRKAKLAPTDARQALGAQTLSGNASPSLVAPEAEASTWGQRDTRQWAAAWGQRAAGYWGGEEENRVGGLG